MTVSGAHYTQTNGGSAGHKQRIRVKSDLPGECLWGVYYSHCCAALYANLPGLHKVRQCILFGRQCTIVNVMSSYFRLRVQGFFRFSRLMPFCGNLDRMDDPCGQPGSPWGSIAQNRTSFSVRARYARVIESVKKGYSETTEYPWCIGRVSVFKTRLFIDVKPAS